MPLRSYFTVSREWVYCYKQIGKQGQERYRKIILSWVCAKSESGSHWRLLLAQNCKLDSKTFHLMPFHITAPHSSRLVSSSRVYISFHAGALMQNQLQSSIVITDSSKWGVWCLEVTKHQPFAHSNFHYHLHILSSANTSAPKGLK